MKMLLKSLLLSGLLISAAAFAVSAQTFDRAPLDAAAASAKANGVDWSKPFTLNVSAVIGRDGKFDARKTSFSGASGDAKTVAAAKKYVAALGESGWFSYLTAQGIDNISANVKSTANQFSVGISSVQTTPERAKTMAAGLNGFISMAANASRNGNGQLGAGEMTLLANSTSTADGKNVRIKVALPAADFRRIAAR